MDLICNEQAENENQAYDDKNLLQDRVLKRLLKDEDRYCIQYSNNFRSIQTEVTVDMRKTVAEWMMEVCEEQKCQDEVFNLAMNYMDRFLMCCRIKKNQLQLLGTACMLIASKLREPRPLSGEMLVYYTDHSVTKEQLWSWELLVLKTLKWDISAVTPQAFLKHILSRLAVEEVGVSLEMVISHAKTLVTLCAREFEFSMYHPSIIACASISSALCGVGWLGKSQNTLETLLDHLYRITSIEKDYIQECLRKIDDMVRSSARQFYQSQNKDLLESEETFRPNEFTPPPSKIEEHSATLTPTDVQNVHF
ncbi:unnamed protein product [Brassicogethes aeneus]|uniref:Uncharacterized protein n=1 Tax=Brassicogethes aeneus TaxID=1431903 RepID=A0A9P0BEL8_BRAAE|nr:unnamed protein product [Brassicogethes aeneus]